MDYLKDALLVERRRQFVGRQSEIEYIAGWINNAGAPTEMIHISGMGGIGKSTLALKYLDLAQQAGLQCLWLDGRLCSESPHSFLDALYVNIMPEADLPPAGTENKMQRIVQAVSNRRTLLCIDNFESLTKLEGWFREVLVPELPASGLLLVLAGRPVLGLDWRHSLAWRGRIRTFRLEPLSRTEVRDYYALFALPAAADIEAMIQSAMGLPLAMAVAADQAMNHSAVDGDRQDWPVSQLVSARLLREAVAPELYEIIDVLSILPQAGHELLNRLLATPITVAQLHLLAQLSFIRPSTDGFALHDVARAHLLEDFRRREPTRFRRLRRRIVEVECYRLRAAPPMDKNRIAAELLSICKDALPHGSFSSFASTDGFDRYRDGDLPSLRRLIAEEEVQKAVFLDSELELHRLLDGMAAHFPEHIRVYRSKEGAPLLFHAGLPLYRETIGFLQTYSNGLLEAIFPKELTRMARLSLAESDTYFHFLGGVDHHSSQHPAMELYELMFTDGLTWIISMGIRFTLIPIGNAKARMLALGGRTRPLTDLPISHPAYGEEIVDLDLRTRDFGEWVISFLEESLGDPIIGASSPLSAEDVRAAFSLMGDPDALERSNAARALSCSGSKLQEALRALLQAEAPPAPVSKRSQFLLRQLRKEPHASPDAAASKLHISRATYYRHLSEAAKQAAIYLSYACR